MLMWPNIAQEDLNKGMDQGRMLGVRENIKGKWRGKRGEPPQNIPIWDVILSITGVRT